MSDNWIKFPTEPGVWAVSRYNKATREWSAPDYTKITAVVESDYAHGEDFGDERGYTVALDAFTRWRKVGEFAAPDEDISALKTFLVTFQRRVESTTTVTVSAASAGQAEGLAWAKLPTMPWGNGAISAACVAGVKEMP